MHRPVQEDRVKKMAHLNLFSWDVYNFWLLHLSVGGARETTSVWSTPDPGRLRVCFSAEAGPGSHKTGSISASTVSNRLRIAVDESCVTNLMRVPRWFFAAAWYTAARRQNRPPPATPCLSGAVLAQGPRTQFYKLAPQTAVPQRQGVARGSHSRDGTTTILLSKFSKKACTTLGDERLCRVYHVEFCFHDTPNAKYRQCLIVTHILRLIACIAMNTHMHT